MIRWYAYFLSKAGKERLALGIPERYKRNMQALSEKESAALRSKRVAVIGCGGLGGYCIEQLARLGVGQIIAVDGDVFEESNLNRQLFATQESLGRSKAQVAAERVLAVNAEVCVDAREVLLNEHNAAQLVSGCDCVIDCLDNLDGRFWLAQACQAACVPLVYGAIAGWYGQVCTVFPGDASFVSVYGEPFEYSAKNVRRGAEVQEGVLPFAASATAAFQVAETIKVLVGRPDVLRNRLLMIDMLFGSCDEMELK